MDDNASRSGFLQDESASHLDESASLKKEGASLKSASRQQKRSASRKKEVPAERAAEHLEGKGNRQERRRKSTNLVRYNRVGRKPQDLKYANPRPKRMQRRRYEDG